MKKRKLLTILIIAVILLALFVFLENAKNNDRLRKHDDPGMNTENNTIDAPSGNTAEPLPVKPVPVLVINAGGKTFYASFEDNSSAKAFIEKLSSEPLSIELHDYGTFEKVGPLPWDLPRNDEQITTVPGDIILYQGDQITIYYDKNTWSFTRLARISDVTKEELLEAFGSGNVTVSFSIEWSE